MKEKDLSYMEVFLILYTLKKAVNTSPVLLKSPSLSSTLIIFNGFLNDIIYKYLLIKQAKNLF